jgi:transposase
MQMKENHHRSAPGRRTRRYFDEQFKRDAVALVEQGRCAAQLARELGISPWNLRDWKLRYGGGCAAARNTESSGEGGPRSMAQLAGELADLRRELARVSQQRDILKKALAIVGLDGSSATPCSEPSVWKTPL